MGARECLRREISWWPLVSFKFLVFFLNQVAQLVGSQFLIQGSNPGPESESFEPQPLDSQGIPHNSCYYFIFSIYSFIWLLWVLVAAYRISAASRGIFACSKDGPSPAVVHGLSGGGVQA